VTPLKKVIQPREKAIAEEVIRRKRNESVAAINGFDYSQYERFFDAFTHWTEHEKLWSFAYRDVSQPQYVDFVHHYTAVCRGTWGEDGQFLDR